MHEITPILNGDSNQSGDNDIELSTQAYLKKWKVEWAMSHTELTEHLSNHSASHNSSDSGTKSLSYRQRLRFNTSESQTKDPDLATGRFATGNPSPNHGRRR